MLAEDRDRFGPVAATLRDGRRILIRPLRADDGEALAEFYQAVPREDYRFYCPHPLTREHALRKATQRADAASFVCLVAQGEDGRVAGYAWFDWKEPLEQSPSSGFGICVRRGWQGGTGRALMVRLLEIAATVGPPRMHLTVQKANAPAVALYTKMGFAIVREQTRGPFEEFASEPEYYMERPVR